MTARHGLRKKGWWAVEETAWELACPPVSGDKFDKENIPP
jgi:hypothetical protein